MHRKPVYFTFGNHMHWVDMQWLWGYDVLPGCVRDMLHLCRETGVKSNVNFDAIGYEKMAAESPDALQELREAVKQGSVEPVGCSYGQPYGLFQGGESNVRQFTNGVRTTRRLLDFRPCSFWEEEFYFFPQLPQILCSCGYTGANLFFQWTWHTPEIPKEPHSLILWEGIDGSRMPTLPRNELNLHQWREDFAPLFESELLNELDEPAIVQWIELMPSRDWMCRSEVLLPKLKELLANPEIEIVPATMGELIGLLHVHERTMATRHGAANDEKAPTMIGQVDASEGIPVRYYSPDDVWHGMTLGKNGDRHPRASRNAERLILGAEALASIAGLLGRPYPSWDVYPTWELDEAWRELLAAQHHDNHECEGLCGFVGYHQMDKARSLALEVGDRTLRHLMDRTGEPMGYNAFGFERPIVDHSCDDDSGNHAHVHAIQMPPFGYASPMQSGSFQSQRQDIEEDELPDIITLRRGDFAVSIDSIGGIITQIRSREYPDGVLDKGHPILIFSMQVNGRPWQRPPVMEHEIDEESGKVTLWIETDPLAAERPASNSARFWRSLEGADTLTVMIDISLAPFSDAVDVTIFSAGHWPRPDDGLTAALRLPVQPKFEINDIRCDSPYAVHAVNGSGRVRRKYPSGDWMTSEQWFEELEGSIVARSFIDLLDDNGNGLLISHNGSQQVFRTRKGIEFILNAADPWDEVRHEMPSWSSMCFRFEPHASRSNADCVRAALCASAEWVEGGARNQDAFDPENHPGAVGGGGPASPGTAPATFGGPTVENARNVIATAFYRESMKSGEHLPEWAGHRMHNESDGACEHPFVIRLVEYDGEEADVVLKLPGEVALVAKTNLMGEVIENDGDTRWLHVEYPADPPEWVRSLNEPIRVNGDKLRWSAVRFTMRPREIATIMCDLVLGRKQWRNLDEKREVWATVHRK